MSFYICRKCDEVVGGEGRGATVIKEYKIDGKEWKDESFYCESCVDNLKIKLKKKLNNFTLISNKYTIHLLHLLLSLAILHVTPT
jgi:hypothetical protein